MLMITNIEAQMGIYLKEKDLRYSELQDIWALVIIRDAPKNKF